MKKILSIDELIDHMKKKGIHFDKMSEDDAKEFLEHHNYYMKLSAYRANYPKCPPESKRAGQYQNLDFAYLKELSTIDMHLRYYVLQMCLDIEQAIKVMLVEYITEDAGKNDEDGYKFVKDFFKYLDERLDLLRSIKRHKSGEYCKDLIVKYYPYFPIWVLVELISFGELIRLCSYYDETHEKNILIEGKFLNIIRDLRNASAHSNCLLNKAAAPMEKTKQPDKRITEYVKQIQPISKDSRSKYLNIRFCYNMVVLFYAYDHYMNIDTRIRRFKQLKEFMENRVVRHKNYFTGNSKLCGVYLFMKKVIDNFADGQL